MSPSDSDRIAALEARVVELERRMATAEDTIEDLANDEDEDVFPKLNQSRLPRRCL